MADERILALQAMKSVCSPDEILRYSTQALADQDPSIRALAAKLTGAAGHSLADNTIVQLESMLTDSDPDVRFEASRALLRNQTTPTELAIRMLLEFLDEPETHALMIAAVVTALTEGNPSIETVATEIRPRLSAFLNHERAEVREAVATAFAKWPRIAAMDVEPLLPLLDDSEPLVREKIAFALGEARVASDNVKTALKVASQDEDVEVARHAAEAIQKLGF